MKLKENDFIFIEHEGKKGVFITLDKIKGFSEYIEREEYYWSEEFQEKLKKARKQAKEGKWFKVSSKEIQKGIDWLNG